MNTSYRIFIYTISTIVVSSLSLLADNKLLSPERVSKLTAPTKATSGEQIWVELSSFGKVYLAPRPDPQAVLENIREFRYPSEFEPPKVIDDADHRHPDAIVPTTPTRFETINVGWTINLHATRQGSVVILTGVAEFISIELVNGDYGALAGPIYSKRGEFLTSNKLQQPLQQTTTSRFHLSAVPGKTYEVLLYRGKKVEKHSIKVLVQ